MEDCRVSVVLADDHTILRQSLAELLDMGSSVEVVGEAENGAQAVKLVETLNPDVILLDIEMPIMDGLEALGPILVASPEIKIIILTMHEDPRLIREAMSYGASAYVLKRATRDELQATILSVVCSQTRTLLALSEKTMNKLKQPEGDILTDRQLEILLLAARGMSNQQIASSLHLSRGTVKRHLSDIYTKLQVGSRSQATQRAFAEGWITARDLTQLL